MTEEERRFEELLKHGMFNGAFQQQPERPRVHPSNRDIDTLISRCIKEKDYTYPELLREWQMIANPHYDQSGKYNGVSMAMVWLAPDIISRLNYLVHNPNTKLDTEE